MTTTTTATTRMLPSENDSVSEPRYTPGAEIARLRLNHDACGLGLSHHSIGRERGQPRDSVHCGHAGVEGQRRGVDALHQSRSANWGIVPAGAVKISPVGSTMGPRWLPAGRTFRITETDCGLFTAVGASTWTVAIVNARLQAGRVDVHALLWNLIRFGGARTGSGKHLEPIAPAENR